MCSYAVDKTDYFLYLKMLRMVYNLTQDYFIPVGDRNTNGHLTENTNKRVFRIQLLVEYF